MIAGCLAWVGFFGHRLALSRPDSGVLRFAHTFTTESERAILKDVTAEFERLHPGVRVVHNIQNSDTYNTAGWRIQFQSRRQPDVYFCWQGFKVEEAIARGWAAELTPHLSPGFVGQFHDGVLKRQRGGGLYFLPQSVDLSVLVWFNEEVFKRLGLREPATFEEWLGLCATLRSNGVLPLVQGNRDLWPMGNFAGELVAQSSGETAYAGWFAPRTRIEGAATRGLEQLGRLAQGGAFDLPGTLEKGALNGLGDIDAKVIFLSGKAAQHVVGSWFLADVEDAAAKGTLKFPVGVFPVPSAVGETNALAAVTTGFLVNPRSGNVKAAVALLELLLSRKYQERFARLGSLSARRDAAEFGVSPLAGRLARILANSPSLIAPPDTGFSPDQAGAFYELTAGLLSGRVPVAEAASRWAREKEKLARKGL